METIIARRVILAGFLWTRVPWILARRTVRPGEWANSLKKKGGGGGVVKVRIILGSVICDK